MTGKLEPQPVSQILKDDYKFELPETLKIDKPVTAKKWLPINEFVVQMYSTLQKYHGISTPPGIIADMIKELTELQYEDWRREPALEGLVVERTYLKPKHLSLSDFYMSPDRMAFLKSKWINENELKQIMDSFEVRIKNKIIAEHNLFQFKNQYYNTAGYYSHLAHENINLKGEISEKDAEIQKLNIKIAKLREALEIKNIELQALTNNEAEPEKPEN